MWYNLYLANVNITNLSFRALHYFALKLREQSISIWYDAHLANVEINTKQET